MRFFWGVGVHFFEGEKLTCWGVQFFLLLVVQIFFEGLQKNVFGVQTFFFIMRLKKIGGDLQILGGEFKFFLSGSKLYIF